MAGTKSTAALPLETADASGAPTVDDKVAILVAHQVATETAALTEQIETLKTENARLTTEVASLTDKVEVAETAKAGIEQAFADYKAEQAKAVEAAKLADERKAEIAKVAPALEATEERVTRWTSMDEAAWQAHVADLASVAGTSGQGESLETAMNGTKVKTPITAKSTGRTVLGLPKS